MLLLLASLALALAAADPATQFDAFAARAFKDWQAVGLAVTVIKDGRIVFARGYGVRELGKPEAVDTNTLFAIGSTTKAMTAAALGMLVDEGKLRWDDPVTQFLPWFALQDPTLTRTLTVRDLLTHRAGLGNADVLWYETDLSPAEVLRRARFIPIAYTPRAGFIYQNIMYAAAGAVVTAASGMPWEEFIRRRIFEPLGMRGSVTSLADLRGRPDVATPHDLVNDTLRVIENASVDAVAAAGAVWSSVADMGKWIRFMVDSGRVGGQALLKPGTWAELLEPQSILTNEAYPAQRIIKPHWNTYGLGWFQQDYAGRMMNYHTGSIDGMVAIAAIIPEERFGVYVLANRDHVELRHALMYQAIDLWLGHKARDWSAELLALYGKIRNAGDSARRAFERSRVTGTSPSLTLAAYAGTYADSLAGAVRVVEQGGVLRLVASSRRAATLEHWHFDTFRARWDKPQQGSSMVLFRLDARARPEALEMDGIVLGRVP